MSFEAIPEYAITFSVEGTNGTLKAMINGEEITSGTEIEEGKTVTFTAMPEASYRVKEWKVDGKPVADAGKSNTYAHTVTKVATITVSFELKPKHAITFSVDGANGKLTAKADGIDETETSPITVEEGKTITFTATANAGYKVKEWKVGDTALQDNKENTYTHTVTQASTIKVSFELLPAGTAILTLDPNKLSIKVKAKTADGSSINVKGCTVSTLASGTETTLTATDTKVILKGKIIELNFSGAYNNKQPLTAIDVSGLTYLQLLNCSYNQLTELNVQGLTSLQWLNCSYNQLPEFNVQGLTALQELDCQNNQLKTLNVQGLTSLEWLYCNKNQLTALNVQGCTALKYLICSYNQLPELNVQGLTSLKWLYCYYNQLTALNLQDLTSLKELKCYGNKINAEAMTELLNALPTREVSDKGNAILYTEYSSEGNCKDFSTNESLKEAAKEARRRKWRLKYEDSNGDEKYIVIKN